jgi:DNA-binding transcriptional ArsR family regulator
MSDIFKAIADPKARLLLEQMAEKPGSTAAKLAEASKLKSEQVTKLAAILVEAKLVKSTGSGASKKYSLNAKGFTPYVSWLAKVAETQAVSNLELQLVDLGEKLGKAIASGSEWVTDKVAENIQGDPKQWGKQLGKIFAEVKVELQKEAKFVQKEAKSIATGVKKQAKTMTTGVKKEVKSIKTGVKKEAKAVTKKVKASVKR